MKTALFSIVLVLNLACSPFVRAEDHICWLTAPLQDDVWVIVNDADDDGNRGDVIWEGKISAGGKIKVSSSDGFIRYDYKRAPDQSYQGNNSVGCSQQRDIAVK